MTNQEAEALMKKIRMGEKHYEDDYFAAESLNLGLILSNKLFIFSVLIP